MKPSVAKKKIGSETYDEFRSPPRDILPDVPALNSRGDRPLNMTFENQLNALIWFHLPEHDSAGCLVFDLNGNDFAKECIAPDGGISRSSFSEAVDSRGFEQLQHVFRELSRQARAVLPVDFQSLGELVAIDGSLIDAVFSMYRADYRKKSKKAEGHFGFDINRGIPTEVRPPLSRTDRSDGQRISFSQAVRFTSERGGKLRLPYQSGHNKKGCPGEFCQTGHC